MERGVSIGFISATLITQILSAPCCRAVDSCCHTRPREFVFNLVPEISEAKLKQCYTFLTTCKNEEIQRIPGGSKALKLNVNASNTCERRRPTPVPPDRCLSASVGSLRTYQENIQRDKGCVAIHIRTEPKLSSLNIRVTSSGISSPAYILHVNGVLDTQ